MFNFIRKSYPHFTHSLTTSSKNLRLFSSKLGLKPTSENGKDQSFTVNYFINKCGFPPEKAISASKYVKICKPHKADAVIAFFKNQGFSESQVLKLIRTFPPVVLSDPEKTLLPKIDFFLSQGVSNADLPKILVVAPSILSNNLDRKIVPTFNCLKKLLGSVEDTIITIIHGPRLLIDFKERVVPNIDILQKAGVPEARIRSLLKNWPSILTCRPTTLEEIVDEVGKMGVDPLSSTFVVAVYVSGQLSRSSWEKKIAVYKRWGCSEDEVLAAFKINPWCMSVSKDKIDGIMGFFVNEMGWDSSRLMQSSIILSLSLNRRIIPRCSVYRVLLSKGFTKKLYSVSSLLRISEDKFRKRCIDYYEEEAPELLKVYQEKLELAR